MLRVYLAAPYRRKEEMRDYAIELRSLGIEVTSRWLDEPDKPTVQIPEVEPTILSVYAEHDVDDVITADVLVFFTDPSKQIIRAGRHVEFGMALALNIPILVVGLEHENIFHFLPEVQHFESWLQVRNELYSRYAHSMA